MHIARWVILAVLLAFGLGTIAWYALTLRVEPPQRQVAPPKPPRQTTPPASPRGTVVRKADPRDPKTNIPLSILALPTEEQKRKCLGLNIYYEARSESEEGMRMVGYVTVERVKLARSYWGHTICEAVFKKTITRKKRGKRWVTIHTCQFSWACMRKVQPRPRDFVKWTKALRLAREQQEGKYTPPARFKHALYYLRPEHSTRKGMRIFKKLVFLGKVDHHHFYGERRA